MKKLVLFAVFLLVFILAVQLVNAYGLSVVPAFIKMIVIRGQQFDILISVTNPDSAEWTYLIRPDDNITDWVSFYMENQSGQISQITIPAASSDDFIASFNIPNDTPNGNYLSNIFVETLYSTSGSQNLTSSLKIRVPISVSLDVIGSQVLAGLVTNITTTDTEINRLLRIKTEFKNIGEVIAIPRIEGVIKKNGVEVGNFTHNTTSVKVGNTSVIDTEWDTTGQTVGDYVANVKVYLDFRLIEEENLNFKILERGSLTAEGIIEEVKASSEITTGQPAKIEVQFQNTGQIDLIAKISGEVYQDNNFVDTLQSDETWIRVGENETLTAYFKPTKDGSYLIKSNVVYEGKKEPISDITLNSIGGSAIFDTSFLSTQNIIIIFVIIAFAFIVIGIMYDRKKKSKK